MFGWWNTSVVLTSVKYGHETETSMNNTHIDNHIDMQITKDLLVFSAVLV